MITKKNINYINPNDGNYHSEIHKLDLILPQNYNEKTPVIVFIHGGMWIFGSKDPYFKMGEFFIEKGIGVVTINYRLGVDFRLMAQDCAKAVKFIADNYSENITLMGHSAGGHLSALIALDKSYVEDFPDVRGCILVDAFGLCLDHYITQHGAGYLHYVEQVFSREPALWQKASPVSFIEHASFPFLIYTGGSTYPFLKDDNKRFAKALEKAGKQHQLIEIKGKSHQEMITQFSDKNLNLYSEIAKFAGNSIEVSN